jgi:phage FluMu protein Com
MTVHASLALKEARCVRCGRLLLKWRMAGLGHVEVKCPRCQQMNFLNFEEPKAGISTATGA